MERVYRALSLYFNHSVRRRTPTIVYSMERSGSVALLHSLRSSGVFAMGAHYLDPQKLAQHPERHSGSAHWACRNIIRKRRPARVVSLVRHPIENMLSRFAREDLAKAGRNNAEPPTVSELSTQFCDNYLRSQRFLQPLGWFDSEFQAALGIDVYEHDFDHEQRSVRIREGRYDVLIMRTEIDDAEKAKLLADFVGIAAMEMSTPALAAQTSATNRRNAVPPGLPLDQTEYAAAYRAFKHDLKIPEEFLKVIVDSQYVKHFFSTAEREAMQREFGGNSAQDLSIQET